MSEINSVTTDFSHISKLHTGLSEDESLNAERLCLHVSPTFNVSCKFCSSDSNNNEDGQGVDSGIAEPKDVVETIRKALEINPRITEVGISGPGDTLATPHAIETFKLVNAEYPDLIKSMSTNGLLLYKYAMELYEAGVDTITVTINAVDPYIESQITSYIVYEKKVYYGIEAAKILIKNQLKGIAVMSSLGVTVKINSVLIPGINDKHIEEIAETVKAAGATLFNIIPLIPQYELSLIPAPSRAQLDKARILAKKHIKLFTVFQS